MSTDQQKTKLDRLNERQDLRVEKMNIKEDIIEAKEEQREAIVNSIGTRTEYAEKTQLELDRFNAEIEEMKARSAQEKVDAKLQYTNLLDELAAKRDALQEKFNQVDDSTEEALDEVKAGVEKALGELQLALDKAAESFK